METSQDIKKLVAGSESTPLAGETAPHLPPHYYHQQQVAAALLQKIERRLHSHSADSQSFTPDRLGLLLPIVSEPDTQRAMITTLLGPDRDAAFVALSMLRLFCDSETRCALMAYACEPTHPLPLRIRCVLALKSCSDDPTVAQLLVQLSRTVDLASLRQATAQSLIPAKSAPTELALARLREMASVDYDPETRWQAAHELFSRHEAPAPELLAAILEGPCDLNSFVMGLPLHSAEWSPALVLRVLQVYSSAPGPRPWEITTVCTSCLAKQGEAFPKATASSLVTALRELQASGAMNSRIEKLVLDRVKSIVATPAHEWSPSDKDRGLELFCLIRSKIANLLSKKELSDDLLDASLCLKSLIQNNYLPERFYCSEFMQLIAELPSEVQLRLKKGFLSSKAFEQRAGCESLFSFLYSLPGNSDLADQFFESALHNPSHLDCAEYVRKAFAYISQEQKSWNLSDLKQIHVVDLMRALHRYRGPDADEIRALVEKEYLKVSSEQLPYELYLTLSRPLSKPDLQCPWRIFRISEAFSTGLAPLPATVCPLTAQQVLKAAEVINPLIDQHLRDEPVTLGFAFAGRFAAIDAATESTYAERFATTQRVVREAPERITHVLQEMRLLCPEIREVPDSELVCGREKIAEALGSAGLKSVTRDAVLKLADKLEAIQEEVNTSVRFCLSHLGNRILKLSGLTDGSSLVNSTLVSSLAPNPARLPVLCAMAALVDQSNITRSPQELFSHIFSEFPDVTVSCMDFFASDWVGDPSIARLALTCAGEHLISESPEVPERTFEGREWLRAARRVSFPIPENLESIAYVGVAATISAGHPGSFLLKDFWYVRDFEELESQWISNPTGARRDMIQTLLRFAAIQVRFPGFDRYLQDSDFQKNLIRIVNSRMPDSFKEIAVLGLSSYGCEEYGSIELKPTHLLSLVKSASTDGDPVSQIYNIRSIPDHYIRKQLRALASQGSAAATARKRLTVLAATLQQSDSRDVRLEMAKKLFPALLQGSSEYNFIREPIVHALGRVTNQEYLTGEMENSLALLDSAFEWTTSPERAVLSLGTDNSLSDEALCCYDLLEFLFKHESSSDPALARGAAFLLRRIFG